MEIIESDVSAFEDTNLKAIRNFRNTLLQVVCEELREATVRRNKRYISHIEPNEHMPQRAYWEALYHSLESNISEILELKDSYNSMPVLIEAYNHLCAYKYAILTIMGILDCALETQEK